MSRTSLVPFVLPADPTQALEAATKQYVDAKVTGSASGPRLLGYVERGTNAGPTAVAATVGLAVTFTLTSQRYIEARAYGRHLTGTAANQYGTIEIRNQGNTAICDGIWIVRDLGSGVYLTEAAMLGRVVALVAGTYTYNVWIVPQNGGSITLAGTGSSPSWLTITDWGPV
jgi:hypothetical protein